MYKHREISTRTITCIVNNIKFNIGTMYDSIPISVNIPYMKYETHEKGVHPVKKSSTRKNIFRNSLTLVINIGNSRRVNVKVPPSGLLQFTGCKEYEYAIEAMEILMKAVYEYSVGAICSQDDEPIMFLLKTHMTNIKIVLGHTIHREQVNQGVNLHTNWISLLETTIGYSGLNIKIPYTYTLPDLPMTLPIVSFNKHTGLLDSVVYKPYKEIYEMYDDAFKKKEQNWYANKVMSVFVFHSGSMTFSGIHDQVMETNIELFLNFIASLTSLDSHSK